MDEKGMHTVSVKALIRVAASANVKSAIVPTEGDDIRPSLLLAVEVALLFFSTWIESRKWICRNELAEKGISRRRSRTLPSQKTNLWKSNGGKKTPFRRSNSKEDARKNKHTNKPPTG